MASFVPLLDFVGSAALWVGRFARFFRAFSTFMASPTSILGRLAFVEKAPDNMRLKKIAGQSSGSELATSRVEMYSAK